MVCPCASKVVVAAYLLVISAAVPTATNFPSLMAKASALLKALSTV